MKKKSVKKTSIESDFESLVGTIVQIHQQAQEFATKAVNVGLTLRNWFIGYRILEFEQKGADRAGYGENLMTTLSQRLASHGLPQVTPRELRRYRQLYQVYPRIWQSVTAESLEASGFAAMLPFASLQPPSIRESVTAESEIVETASPQLIHRLSFEARRPVRPNWAKDDSPGRCIDSPKSLISPKGAKGDSPGQRPGNRQKLATSPNGAKLLPLPLLCLNRSLESWSTLCSPPRTGNQSLPTTSGMNSMVTSVALSETCQERSSRLAPWRTTSTSWRLIHGRVPRRNLSKPSKQALRSGLKPRAVAMLAFIGRADTGCFPSAPRIGRRLKTIWQNKRSTTAWLHSRKNTGSFAPNTTWPLMSGMFGIEAMCTEVFRPFRAGIILTGNPRAVPWAITGRPVGAQQARQEGRLPQEMEAFLKQLGKEIGHAL